MESFSKDYDPLAEMHGLTNEQLLEFRTREDYEVLRAIEAVEGKLPAFREIRKRSELHYSRDGKVLFWDGKVILAITKIPFGFGFDREAGDVEFFSEDQVVFSMKYRFVRYYEMEGGAQ